MTLKNRKIMDVQIKRVYEEPAPSDGYRVLVDRLWPRGVRKEALLYDAWAKNLAPSPDLRRWYHEDQEGRWPQFQDFYLRELESSAAAADFLKTVSGKSRVTLLYAARNEHRNHALVLKKFLEDALK